MSPRVRTFLMRVLAASLYYLGGVRVLAFLSRYLTLGGPGRLFCRQPAFQILVYHRVNGERDPFFSAVPTEVFERQMAYIARHYRVLTVEELVKRMRHGGLPRNALAITFDDGYRDTLTHAAPILAKYGLPATVFLATGFIDTEEAPWFDRVAEAFQGTKVPSFTAPWGGTVKLAAQADRLRALERAFTYFKYLPDEVLPLKLEALLEALGMPDRMNGKNSMLTWDEVEALTRLGFSIGAHTVTHQILSRVSPKRAWQEIVDSKRMIERTLGRPVKAFAYPNGRPGDYTDTVKQLVREAGFTCAVTTRFGVNTLADDPYELKRGGPWEEHLPTFALKLAGYRMTLGA